MFFILLICIIGKKFREDYMKNILMMLWIFSALSGRLAISMENTTQNQLVNNQDINIIWTSESTDSIKQSLQNELHEFCNSENRAKLCLRTILLRNPNENIVFDKNVNHFIDSPIRDIVLDVLSEDLKNIGHIKLRLRLGEHSIITAQQDPIHEGHTEFSPKNPPKSASLDYIEMNTKGYANDTLATFHLFLDKISADYTLLGIGSKNPAAGSIYKKAGYVFTPNTSMAIKEWSKLHNISDEKAEEEFLKDTDTSKPERNISQTALMVRYKH
jgi:hypothetical protein